VALTFLGAAPETPPKTAAPRVRLLVPAYFYPAGEGLKHWDRLIESAKQVPVIAIVNPASGPGKQSDANYVKVIDRARAAGVVLIGYVSTNYAKRPAEQVSADVETWYCLYPKIQGIFFDEQASGAEKVDYYVAAGKHVRKAQPKALIVGNPGTVCAEEYVSRSAVDVVCLVERAKDAGADLPAWMKRYNRERFAGLLHCVEGKERMGQQLRELVQKNVGYLYLTSAVLPNPWDRLPEWWDAEVAAGAEVNKAAEGKKEE
jgi:Spherulation-specific family 4